MLNEGAAALDDSTLKVLEGLELKGAVNLSDEALIANIRSAIQRPYPQIRPQPNQIDRIVLVGSGPSLASTERELRDAVFAGAKLATVNGAYHWCLERNLQPSVQIVMDGRASNARFVEPAIPRCKYILASQCAPETWDAVDGRPDVWMFHAASGEADGVKTLLDTHYLGQWFGVGGGTTVITRAITLLRSVGYLRFDLFGVDCCWMDGQHHAMAQPENANDKPFSVTVTDDETDSTRTFVASPWHLKQFEDFLQLIRVNGEHFLLNVHGEGLLAHALATKAALHVTEE